MTKFTLPELPYSYDALEPFLDERTMRIHYDKHHRGYLNKLNEVLEGYEDFVGDKTIEDILSDLNNIPPEVRQDVINFGGGFANHNLYWQVLSPNGGGEPTGELKIAIDEKFVSFENFKKELTAAATNHFGSGWGWLVVDEDGELEIMSTSNQNSPLSVGKTPILAIDVWEHAYYLQYQNLRNVFTNRIWNVINWDEVEKRYNKSSEM